LQNSNTIKKLRAKEKETETQIASLKCVANVFFFAHNSSYPEMSGRIHGRDAHLQAFCRRGREHERSY